MIAEAIEMLLNQNVDILKHEIFGIRFTAIEFSVFLSLISAAGEVLTETEIKELVGMYPADVKNTNINVHIKRIRDKLKDKYEKYNYIILRTREHGYFCNMQKVNKLLNLK